MCAPAGAIEGSQRTPPEALMPRRSARTGRAGGRQPPISNRGHATIDRKVYACDEACFVRRKEQGGRRDLLRAAEPPKRHRCGELGSGLVGAFLGRRLLVEDRRVDRTRAYRIDADAALLQLGRPGADEGADCRLSGAVGGEAGDALVLGDRCDHDDRPAVIQKRQGFLDREGQAARVDRKDLVEAFLRRLGERLRINDARPGEEDIDLCLLAGDLGVEPVEIGEVRYVSLYCSDAAADQRYRLVQFRLAARGDVDERTFFNEALGGGETHSAAAASDDGNFSLELWH